MTVKPEHRPGQLDFDSVLALPERLSAWHRWGTKDTAGALNFVTPDVVRTACATVTSGRTVSMSWDIDPQIPDERGAPHRHMLETGQGLHDEARIRDDPNARLEGAAEHIGMAFHGYTITHLDALSHCFWDARMYGGLPAELVTARLGATAHDVRSSKPGIITRGVLVNGAQLRGERWLEPGDTVTAADIERLERDHGFRIQSGDAVFLRTGFGLRRRELGPLEPDAGYPGWDASCLPLFAERKVSMVGADTANDALPNPYGVVGMSMPVHAIGIVAMGLRLIDNCDLEGLQVLSDELGRYTFLLTMPTLPLIGCTGSPVNPIAIF